MTRRRLRVSAETIRILVVELAAARAGYQTESGWPPCLTSDGVCPSVDTCVATGCFVCPLVGDR